VVIEPAPPKPVVSEPIPPPAAPAPQPSRDVAGDEKVITSPMPGMIVRYEKKVGDTVNLGETVVILEAMKMENALASTGDGVIESIAFSSGDAVAKGDILCVIG
jgi:oxaloacetate decarboxylase alpha subunit/pyruvate carboxylase subunit B